MKKLISIGVALALLAMVVLPVGVAAVDYRDPPTYAKVPFGIVAAVFQLLDEILPDILNEFAPDFVWLADLMAPIGDFTYEPLAWSVDMMAWGVSLGADVVGFVAAPLGLPGWIEGMLNTVACGLRTCFDPTCVGNFTCPR